MVAAIENKIILYFDKIIKNGALDNIPVSTAPAPKTTNNEGKAQHTNVPILVKRLKEGTIKFLAEIGFMG
tara:strand:- start:258 stop:467 length:210 start_codon:yes stop_codon:yes gene_type:complete